MKETYYFSHDYDAINDPKMQSLVSEYGATGYGIIWCIYEMLHSEAEHKLPLKDYIYIAIAKQLSPIAKQNIAIAKQDEANESKFSISSILVSEIIQHCIKVCELLQSDDYFVWSNRVNCNFEKRLQVSEKRALAGKKGGEAKAIAKQNIAKHSKEKEKKEKEKEIKLTKTYLIFLLETEDGKKEISEIANEIKKTYEQTFDFLKRIFEYGKQTGKFIYLRSGLNSTWRNWEERNASSKKNYRNFDEEAKKEALAAAMRDTGISDDSKFENYIDV